MTDQSLKYLRHYLRSLPRSIVIRSRPQLLYSQVKHLESRSQPLSGAHEEVEPLQHWSQKLLRKAPRPAPADADS